MNQQIGCKIQHVVGNERRDEFTPRLLQGGSRGGGSGKYEFYFYQLISQPCENHCCAYSNPEDETQKIASSGLNSGRASWCRAIAVVQPCWAIRLLKAGLNESQNCEARYSFGSRPICLDCGGFAAGLSEWKHLFGCLLAF